MRTALLAVSAALAGALLTPGSWSFAAADPPEEDDPIVMPVTPPVTPPVETTPPKEETPPPKEETTPPRPAAERPGDPATLNTGSCRWFMVEAGDMMYDAGGGARLVALCRRAKRLGYNGLLLWDSNLWTKKLPSAYMDNARTLKRGMEELDFTLMIEMCPRGSQLISWSGDESICEPQPRNRTPEERNYRYLCLSHPRVLPIWEEQLKRAEEIYHPDGWLLMYDEIRVAAADERCRQSGKTPAQLLADHTRQAIEMCRRITPDRVVAVWNDMYDPYQNAKPGRYYHVEKGFSGAWEALDKDVLILNWSDKVESFKFFAERGNPQVFCGYYDGELGTDKEGRLVRQARKYPGLIGWMYTTWQANFDAMDSYLALSGFQRPKSAKGKEQLPALFLKQPKKANAEDGQVQDDE